MKQHDGFIKNSDVNVLLAGGGHKPLSEFLDASSLKTVNGQSLIGIGDISAGGETIVPSSGSTLTAEVGKYYRYDTAINSLTVTLPSTALFTSTLKIILYFKTNISNALTLSSSDNIKYIDGYDILGGSTYEVTIMWNGYSWIVTLTVLDSLPVGAKKIEYIEGTGLQWIDTGYRANNGCIMEIDIAINRYDIIMGSHNTSSGGGGTNGYNRNAFYVYSNGVAFDKCEQCPTISYTVSNLMNSRHSYYFDTILYNRIGKIDGSYIVNTTTSLTLSPENNVTIFYNHWSSSIGGGKIYSAKIYNSSGDLIRSFIPVKIGNIGYLYDVISKSIFGSLTSSTFIAGPDV